MDRGFQQGQMTGFLAFHPCPPFIESVTYRTGLEQVEPGKWMTWVFDLPGCFHKAPTRAAAVSQTPRAIEDYLAWREGYRPTEPDSKTSIKTEVAEEFRNLESDNGYWVNSFFEDDKRLVSRPEMDEIIWLLHCTRSDLELLIQRIPYQLLEMPIPGEIFISLSGIINHIAGAEWWYLDKLGLSEHRKLLPTDVLQRLSIVRRQTLDNLARLIDNPTIVTVRGEQWSARKIVRRTLWHERVHTWHLKRRLTELKTQ